MCYSEAILVFILNQNIPKNHFLYHIHNSVEHPRRRRIKSPGAWLKSLNEKFKSTTAFKALSQDFKYRALTIWFEGKGFLLLKQERNIHFWNFLEFLLLKIKYLDYKKESIHFSYFPSNCFSSRTRKAWKDNIHRISFPYFLTNFKEKWSLISI